MVGLGKEFLFIEVQALLHILLQNAFLKPFLQSFSRFLIGRVPAGQLQADHIVRVAFQIGLPLCFADDIVGRAGQLLDPSGFFQLVPQGTERLDLRQSPHLFLIDFRRSYCTVFQLFRQPGRGRLQPGFGR